MGQSIACGSFRMAQTWRLNVVKPYRKELEALAAAGNKPRGAATAARLRVARDRGRMTIARKVCRQSRDDFLNAAYRIERFANQQNAHYRR
ncbi:MAG: hypothetical protein ACREQB_09820 [Candidatus Binataceae bacterium]